jgi:hypothetical protein
MFHVGKQYSCPNGREVEECPYGHIEEERSVQQRHGRTFYVAGIL